MFNKILQDALDLHKQGEFKKALFYYNKLLNVHPFDETLLFLTADAYMREEHNGLAIHLLTNLIQYNPERADAWCNLGTAYRKENFRGQAESCWKKAIEHDGKTVEPYANMASLFADAGQPTVALQWIREVLKIEPDNIQAHWLSALAYLTKADWKNGWPEYKYRQQLENWDSRKTLDCPVWDFRKVKHLYIHGEQGVGDEIMFLSCIDEVLPLADKITIEVNKKVTEIVRQTWPQLNVINKESPGDYDAKIPIGSLAARLRQKNTDFTGKPYLKPSPERIQFYQERLKELGPAPYIGLTWLGGLKATRVEDRSFSAETLKPFMDKYTCISVQYEDTNPIVHEERERIGLHKINDLCLGADLAEQAALFSALDAVVTVQQTAVHVAGAVGTPCYVFLSNATQWRYGLKDTMPWYKSVKLFRKDGDEWPVKRVMEALNADFGKL